MLDRRRWQISLETHAEAYALVHTSLTAVAYHSGSPLPPSGRRMFQDEERPPPSENGNGSLGGDGNDETLRSHYSNSPHSSQGAAATPPTLLPAWLHES